MEYFKALREMKFNHLISFSQHTLITSKKPFYIEQLPNELNQLQKVTCFSKSQTHSFVPIKSMSKRKEKHKILLASKLHH